MQTDVSGRKMIEGEWTGKANEETANWEADEYSWLIDSGFLNQIPFLIRTIITEKNESLKLVYN